MVQVHGSLLSSGELLGSAWPRLAYWGVNLQMLETHAQIGGKTHTPSCQLLRAMEKKALGCRTQ